MKNRICTFITLFAGLFFCCGFSDGSLSWRLLPNGINENDIVFVAVDPNSRLLAATRNGVYQASQDGKKFQRILTFPTGDQHVYSIYNERNWIAVATGNGLWESHDFGKNWQRTFNPAQALHRRCYGVFKRGNFIFVGTAQGLFLKKISENTWHRHKSKLKRQPVYQIIGDQGHIFIAAQDGVYQASNGENLRKVFSVSGSAFEEESNEEAAYDYRQVRTMAYDHGTLYVVTASGIWRISNGQTDRIPSNGLPLSEVEDLEIVTSCLTSHGQWAPGSQCHENDAEPEPVLFLATHRGIFGFLNQQWRPFYQGLPTNHINDLCLVATGEIIAATDQGLFQLYQRPMDSVDYETLQQEFAYEPTIQETQEAVVAYADVAKAKIDQWKHQARMKAFIPSLSLDFDRDATDLYHWDTGASPDELRKGEELLDWGIRLSWDLADAVWSSDQTSIDSRAKLMVELRDDLLNQVTRMYFERRRLQIELLQEFDDESQRWQKQMRVDELTAGLDGMTGGGFSKKCQNSNEK